MVQLQWKTPRPGACKINSDGSRNNATDFSGARGLLRDATSAWIHGFTMNLGASTIQFLRLNYGLSFGGFVWLGTLAIVTWRLNATLVLL